VRWWLEGFAPTRRVTAVLEEGGNERRLLAVGDARLWANRWTAVSRLRQEVPMVADYDIEIAQEATVMDPQVVPVPEGHEIYVRYHPGESVAVVEVWAAFLRHEELLKIDLAGTRNMPEASAAATLVQPRTAVYRAYTAFTVPAVAGASRRVTWMGPAGPVQLSLTFDAGTARPEPMVIERTSLVAFRLGALAGGLDFETRSPTVDEMVERLRPATEDADLAAYASEIVVYGGSASSVQRVAQALLAGERQLHAPTVELRTLTVDAALLRMWMQSGLQPGRVVPAETSAAQAEAGSVRGPAVRMTVLEGVDASFRAGESVTGLEEFEVEVAQQSGGTVPVSGARFGGLAGWVNAHREADGYRLQVVASLSWADARAGTIELAFRPPVGARTERDRFAADGDALQRVTVPALAAGASQVDVHAHLPGDGRDVLLSTSIRGAEAVLLLGRVVPD
jgi:hypothetical protein